MTKLYTYVMRHDTGLAPNPFWKCCTLAVCTPNHQGSRAVPGNFIAGFRDKASAYKMVYLMEISERIHMNEYYLDKRFARKKPIIDGTRRQQCGDNFYSQDKNDEWIQHPNLHHGVDMLEKDTKHPFVFVARRFWYFGRDAVEIPHEVLRLAGGRGARCNHPIGLADQFIDWVKANYSMGLHALPRDFDETSCSKVTLTKKSFHKDKTIC